MNQFIFILIPAFTLCDVLSLPDIEAQLQGEFSGGRYLRTFHHSNIYNPTNGFVEDRNIIAVSFHMSFIIRDDNVLTKQFSNYVRVRGRLFRVEVFNTAKGGGKYFYGARLLYDRSDDTGNKIWRIRFHKKFISEIEKESKSHTTELEISWYDTKIISGSDYDSVINVKDLTDARKGFKKGNAVTFEAIVIIVD